MRLIRALRVFCIGVACAAATAFSGGALAQSQYPTKPVRIIVGFPPGGGTDMLARLVGQKLQERWGQSVIVENRPGGNGIISARAAAAAEPDGYTLYMASSDHLVLVPQQYENLPYDTLRDFAPIIPVANQHMVLVVHPTVPANSVKELIELAKKKPGELNFASWGSGGLSHLTGELFKLTAGIQMVHVPYKGTAPAVTDLLAGRDVSVMFATIASSVPNIKTGKLRGLAITAPERSPVLPEIPTTAEAGYPDFVMFSWNGLFAPAGTPRPIIDKINKDVTEILAMPDVRERLATLGVQASGGTPQAYAQQIRNDLKRWGDVVQRAGIAKERL
ncbi:MAG TPA: tripartite tricarboxylate transporter substrate binding protein [Burkholderiaceae bacterium]|nr:tripartite tricarboxylate transporter substrate binding protein [Burkholderiaceae bacterium]